MSVHAGVPSGPARCLLCVLATALLITAWGCGGGMPSQATIDDEMKAKIGTMRESMKDSMKKSMRDDMRPASKKRK